MEVERLRAAMKVLRAEANALQEHAEWLCKRPGTFFGMDLNALAEHAALYRDKAVSKEAEAASYEARLLTSED